MSIPKTDLASARSAFEALSLSSSRPRVGFVVKGDEKAAEALKSLFAISTDDSLVGSLSFNSSQAAQRDESLFSGPLKKPLLDKHLSHLVKCEKILCSKHNQELAPPVKQSKDHKAQIALQLSVNSFKHLKKYMPGEDEHLQKTCYYRAIVNVLFSELSFLQNIVKQLSTMMTLQHMQDFLVENLGMSWSKSGQRYELSYEIDTLDFSDLESYAFYLRFYKPLKGTKDFEAVRKLLQSQREAFTYYKTSPTAQMLVMMTSLLKDLSEIRAEQCKPLLSDLSKRLIAADNTFHDPCMPHLASVFAPKYGYLLCEEVRQIGKVLTSIDKRDIDPYDTKIWDRPKACLLGMLDDGYLDKQVQIYSHAYEKMRQSVEAKPIYKTELDFDHYSEGSKIAIYSPEQFKSHIAQLKESIKSSIAKCLPISAISLDTVKIEGKEEDRKEEKKSDKKASASGALQTSSAGGSKKKKKKKKTLADKAILDGEKAPSSISTSLAPPISSPTAFLSAPLSYFPDERVRRWYAINLSTLSTIRNFKDTSKGQVVYKYKDLDDEQLKMQLFLHGTAPHLDRILNDPHLRKKYCISTLTGVGIFIELRSLEALSKPIKGVLFYGIDGKIYFHRMIQPFSMTRIYELSLSKLVEEAAQAVLQTMSKELSTEELVDLEKVLSSDVEQDTATVDKFEIMHFIDSKRKCKLSAFPLC